MIIFEVVNMSSIQVNMFKRTFAEFQLKHLLLRETDFYQKFKVSLFVIIVISFIRLILYQNLFINL